MATNISSSEHRYDLDSDRCVCGGVVIYFEMPEVNIVGEGCEVLGNVWPTERKRNVSDKLEDMDMNGVSMEQALATAAELGKRDGEAAASWHFDGNTTKETYEATLRGIEVGDPEILDEFPMPDLSGQWADRMTASELVAEALGTDTLEEGVGENEEGDMIISAYEDAFTAAVHDSLEATCREHLAHWQAWKELEGDERQMRIHKISKRVPEGMEGLVLRAAWKQHINLGNAKFEDCVENIMDLFETLPNGAIVLEEGSADGGWNYVLAYVPNGFQPYVTWQRYKGETLLGNYFNTLEEGQADLRRRCNGNISRELGL